MFIQGPIISSMVIMVALDSMPPLLLVTFTRVIFTDIISTMVQLSRLARARLIREQIILRNFGCHISLILNRVEYSRRGSSCRLPISKIRVTGRISIPRVMSSSQGLSYKHRIMRSLGRT